MAKAKHKHMLYWKDDKTKPVVAAGALIYKFVKKDIYVLTILYDSMYSDIGGKIEKGDNTIAEIAGREIEEETNGLIKSEDIMDRLEKSATIYIEKSKYIMYLIEASSEEKLLTKEDFGHEEIHTGMKRIIGWIKLSDLMNVSIVKFKMNWRLKAKNREITMRLQKLLNGKTFKKKLF